MSKKSRKGRKNGNLEAKEPEDWCFDCKDGGELVVCDHANCGKVYHIDCTGKEESFFESGKSWICGCHYCFNCHKSPKFYCLGCPCAVCKKCYAASEFAIIRGEKGLCGECLELVFIIEQNLEEDSDGNKISLNDRETYETLFKEYWEILKVKEGLNSSDVYAAQAKYKEGKNPIHQRRFIESDEGEEEEDDDLISYDSDMDEPCKHKPGTKRKRSKSREFIGWGSKSLISFLTSIEIDITKPLTQLDATFLIRKYIVDKNLHHPTLKRKFIPDEKLIPIFEKKVVPENKIYSLLAAHFAENLQETIEETNDENKDSSTYKHLDGQTCLESRLTKLLTESLLKKGNCTIKQSCFASINAENIKLIYLKQSLVKELLKQAKSFKDKVIGTFVRVRADPNDHMQRNYHHLVRVIGVNNEFLLQVSFIPNAIPISELSDDDFTEQECETLRQKVKDGLLQKLTVVELQEKARSLHEDITKHWIAMRLVYLQKRIEYANDKGRQREKTELIDEKVELAQPGKQNQLLQQVPTVSPELIEAKDDDEENLERDKQGL